MRSRPASSIERVPNDQIYIVKSCLGEKIKIQNQEITLKVWGKLVKIPICYIYICFHFFPRRFRCLGTEKKLCFTGTFRAFAEWAYWSVWICWGSHWNIWRGTDGTCWNNYCKMNFFYPKIFSNISTVLPCLLYLWVFRNTDCYYITVPKSVLSSKVKQKLKFVEILCLICFMSKFFPYHNSGISKESLKKEDFQRMREMFNLY